MCIACCVACTACSCCVCIGKWAVRILKVLVAILDVIFWLAGCFMIGVGIYLLVDEPTSDYGEILKELEDWTFYAACGGIIAVGVLLFLVGILGICGSCKEDKCLLLTYCMLMSVVVVIQLFAACFFIVFEQEINDYLQDTMYVQVHDMYGTNESEALTTAWDNLQQDLECCGAESYLDYKWSSFYNNTDKIVPTSCCVGGDDNYEDCLDEAAATNPPDYDYENLYNAGCQVVFSDKLTNAQPVIYGILFAVIFLELLAIISAFCLCCEFK